MPSPWRACRAPRLVSVALAVLAALTFGPTQAAAQGEILIPLDAAGFDMEFDQPRQRLYVSIPTRNEVVILSSTNGQVVNRVRIDEEALRQTPGGDADVLVGTRPHGLDISLDGSLLLVALNQASSVVYVDLETLALTQVVIGTQLGHATTWDVIEGKPN
ncbi:MAG TPA: hypothetical protein VIZ31_04945, partial [Vicinamibacteria bacterium]